MRLNGATLAIIAALIIIIGGALYLQNRPTESEEASPDVEVTQTSVPLFDGITLDDVESITVADNSGLEGGESNVIRLERDDQTDDDASAGWVLDSQVSTITSERDIVDTTVNNGLTSLLAMLSTDQFTSDNIAQFSLDAPQYTVTFTTDAGDTLRLRVGNENPAGTQYYVQRDDDETIYLTSNKASVDAIMQLVFNPPFEVIPTPTPVPTLNLPGQVWQNFGYSYDFVNRLTIRNNDTDESVAFIRNDENNVIELLSVNGDDPVAGDEVAMRVVGLDFGGLTAVDALSNVDLATLGLADPQYTITAETENKTYTAHIGDLDPSQTRYYVQFDDSEQVAVVNRADLDFILETLENPPYALVETTPEVEVTPEATPEAEVTPESTEEPDAVPTATDD